MIVSGFPTPALDIVGLFDARWQPCFIEAKWITAQVKETSKAMEHPIESGATMTDHRIILPVEIELSIMLTGETYRNTYTQIREAYVKGEIFSVQTKAGCYPNMLMVHMPHEENPDTFDALRLILTFRQVIVVQAQYEKLPPRKVKNKTHASTVARGEQTGKPLQKRSLLHRLLF